MNLRELVLALRRDILDDLLGDVEDPCAWESEDTGLLWKNAELVRHVNEAQREFARRRPIEDSITTAICRIPVYQGTSEYVIDPRVLHVDRVRFARYALQDVSVPFTLLLEWTGDSPEVVSPLETFSTTSPTGPVIERRSSPQKTTVQRLDEYFLNWETTTNHPDWYIEDMTHYRLRLYPTPDRDGLLELTVGRLPLSDMRWNYRHLDAPEIDARHHLDLLQWAAHKAYMKRDAEVYDPQRAAQHLATFISYVGERPSAALEQVRRQERNLRRRVRPQFF